jgi:hypothetical protein
MFPAAGSESVESGLLRRQLGFSTKPVKLGLVKQVRCLQNVELTRLRKESMSCMNSEGE